MPADKIVSPKFPQGRVQRKFPDPFRRPSIDLGGGPAPKHRDWQTVRVTDIKAGDIIPGLGLVTHTEETLVLGDEVPWSVVVYGGDSNVKVYSGHDTVYAFTADT